MSRQRGFTAAEMTVTTGLASLLMGLTLVTVEGTAKDWRVREASSTLATTLRAARLQAVTEGTPVAVAFDPVAATYAVIAEPGGGTVPPGPHDVKLPGGVAFTTPPSGGTPGAALVGFSDDALTFSSRGRVLGATPPAYVHLGDNRAGSFRRVRVNLAGVVTIERWDGTEWK
jgi:Tfp pilus assembly protein FimT